MILARLQLQLRRRSPATAYTAACLPHAARRQLTRRQAAVPWGLLVAGKPPDCGTRVLLHVATNSIVGLLPSPCRRPRPGLLLLHTLTLNLELKASSCVRPRCDRSCLDCKCRRVRWMWKLSGWAGA